MLLSPLPFVTVAVAGAADVAPDSVAGGRCSGRCLRETWCLGVRWSVAWGAPSCDDVATVFSAAAAAGEACCSICLTIGFGSLRTCVFPNPVTVAPPAAGAVSTYCAIAGGGGPPATATGAPTQATIAARIP